MKNPDYLSNPLPSIPRLLAARETKGWSPWMSSSIRVAARKRSLFLQAAVSFFNDSARVAVKEYRFTPAEIKKLKDNGYDPHDLKPNSKYDIFKDQQGNLEVWPKSGEGPGDPLFININDL